MARLFWPGPSYPCPEWVWMRANLHRLRGLRQNFLSLSTPSCKLEKPYSLTLRSAMLRTLQPFQRISRNVIRIRGKISENSLRKLVRAMSSDAQPITALPAAKQIIEHDGIRYTTIKEGLAHILIPEASVEQNA